MTAKGWFPDKPERIRDTIETVLKELEHLNLKNAMTMTFIKLDSGHKLIQLACLREPVTQGEV